MGRFQKQSSSLPSSFWNWKRFFPGQLLLFLELFWLDSNTTKRKTHIIQISGKDISIDET